jgi:diguanylate cyclase
MVTTGRRRIRLQLRPPLATDHGSRVRKITATMHTPTDALWIAAVALAVAAIALTVIGRRQRQYRGWRCWVAALWMVTAAATLAALGGDRPLVAWAVQALLLPWPVLTLIGLRRFQARGDWPAGERTDVSVLAGAQAITAAAALAGPASIAHGFAPLAAAVAVHLYVAAVLCGRPVVRDGVPARLLGIAVAVAALWPALLPLPGAEARPPAHLRLLALAPAALVAAFATLLMVGERNERELRNSRRRLRVLAHLDTLTQLPNRRRFEELARRAQLDAGDAGTLLLMFDIDHFKQINDRLGHAAGDRALCLVAASVQSQLRAPDVAARLGGDEFVLLLRGATVEAAMSVSARMVTQLQDLAAQQGLPPLSLSFGIVQWPPREALPDALHRADLALYEAKRQGRSCAVAAHGDREEPQFSESRRLGLTAL